MENTEHVSFDLTLSETLQGKSVLKNPELEFDYVWNVESNTGIANLRSINGTPVNIVLHPLGIKGQLDFMSDIEPTPYHVDALPGPETEIITIIIERVILDVDGEKRTAAMIYDHGTIIASDGFTEDSAAKQLPTVEIEAMEAPEGVEPPIMD